MFQRKVLAGAIVAASISTPSIAQIEEVMVTATKRSASTQDIPVTVTALGEESLEQMGVANFSDYLIQLPGVTAGGGGPGQNTIYIRGIASTTPNLTTAGVAGLSPNVALYLDEQPLSQPGRNLDVYTADMARVEVLAGPQGTLYGASSQAGTIRLITNKPDPSGFGGKLKFGTAYTKGGEPSNNAEGVVNFPVTDNLTVRAVGYVDNQGGYIDNVAGTVDASSSARFRPEGTVRANGVPVSGLRAGFQSTADLSNVNFLKADNGARTEDDFNEATYAGSRFSALWDINEDWNLLVGAAQQTLDAEGVFFVDPDLDDYEIQRYERDSMEDSFENFSWTLQGRIAELEAVYTGAFTDRDTDQFVDYTDYLFVGQYIPYYICDYSVSYPGGADPSGTCQAPNLFVKSETETEVQTHEIRFSTDSSARLRATFGAFYSDLELREVNSFTYPGSNSAIAADGVSVGFGPNFSAQGASTKYKGQWPEGVVFRNDVLRTDEQLAAFGELSFDISDQFSTTIGARWYDVEVDLKGSAAGSFGNFGATVDNNAGNNLDELFTDTANDEGVIGKVSFTWTPSDDLLFYVLWSEGFRPGLLNRPGGASNGAGYTVPFTIETDEVTNYEFGWKTDLLDGSLRFNGSIFMVEIERMQTGIFDPSIANLFFTENAADAEVVGMEGDVTWQPQSIEGLIVSGGFSILDTEITDVLIPTGDVNKGDELAFAPELQANLQARYEWTLANGNTAHVMPHLSYSDESYTDIITINRMQLDSWVMVGVTAGVSNDQWTAELYIDNLTDEQAEVSGNFNYDRERITVSRPMTGGVRFSYNF
ncbi:TonB-dependent receptor [Oceanicoccus sagamiensis]|uniref:TonB-dependent receptor n=1 Tax=Oceanicoccus sagamiensis TaxID=716816 RepID=A0A1X9N7H1_9GAMM|nr:TonB-dependent receptor [Oceanicoccus sagamiensis]ARN73141.1 TonB-dependent receptor [Oceanicoccus sagamiensis]